jgi:hypothetical protein
MSISIPPITIPPLPSLPSLSSELTALENAVSGLTSKVNSNLSAEFSAVQAAVNSLTGKLSTIPVLGPELAALESAVTGVIGKAGTLPNITQVNNAVTVISNSASAILAAIKVIQALAPAAAL